MSNELSVQQPGQNGGKRAGAGRKPGAATRVTRSLANELCRQGLDGLSLMLKVAIFWNSKVDELHYEMVNVTARVNAVMDKLDKDGIVVDADDLKDLKKGLVEHNKIGNAFLASLDKLLDTGDKMAPYTNCKLQSIELRGEIDVTHSEKIDEKKHNLDQAAEIYAGSLRTDNVLPFAAKRMAT